MGLSRIRFIDNANVFKAGQLAVHLTREDSGSVTFRYKEGYFTGLPQPRTLAIQMI